MIYILYMTGGDLTDVRVFTSFSHMEQEVLRMARLRQSWGSTPDWCTVHAYEGVDELVPVWGYYVHSTLSLVRYALSPSPSGSSRPTQ